jgi:hypothetical protein
LVSQDTTANPYWFVQPDAGFYRLRVHDRFRQKLNLDLGDFLLLNLTSRESEPFRRAVYAEEWINRAKPRYPQQPDGWLLAVLQNEPLIDQSLRLLVTLENTRDLAPQEGVIRQHRPHFVWFEVTADGISQPSLRWGNCERYPAPAWRLDLADWERDGRLPRPVLSAWWSERLPPEAAQLPRHPAKPLRDDFQTPGADVAKDGFVIESVTVEPVPGRNVPGLVVRLHHEAGRPFLVQVDGLAVEGWEHRFYSQANQYTGIFWPVAEADSRKAFALKVISLDEFKRTALKVEKWELPMPQVTSQAPPQVSANLSARSRRAR